MNVKINGTSAILISIPNDCPFCFEKISPTYITNIGFQVVFQCTNDKCQKLFIAYYSAFGRNPHNNQPTLKVTSVMFGTSKKKEFHKSIEKISKDFIEIYNQSFFAEQSELTQIAGVGYRKSLEYLIKDFSISKNPNEADKIKKAALAQTINLYISDPKLKDVAKWAAWLGNDETHYERKWIDKDLTDLKNTIDLALVYIQADFDYEELKKSMSID